MMDYLNWRTGAFVLAAVVILVGTAAGLYIA